MKLVALVKRVPTTDAVARVSADGKSLDASGLQFMLSFYDEIAVEQAVLLKEKHGGEVTVLSLGPSDVQKELRECLAKGADSAVILKDETWSSRDARSTAKAIAAKLRGLGADLILAGRVATDRDNASVGPMIAAELGIACVTDVVELSIEAGQGIAKRESEAGLETSRFSLPALITCQKGLAEPRLSNLKGIMAAKKKPLEEVPAEAVASQAQVLKLELPPPRPAGRILGEGAAAMPARIDALANQSKVL